MTAEIVALVPIRGLHNGKTRLAGVLAPEVRATLTERMLRGVVAAVLDSGVVQRVAVISPDPDALALARTLGARVVPLVQAASTPGLNGAATAGRAWALEQGATALLVVFGDLPLLTPADIRQIVETPAAIVVAPDRHETGTNALLLRFGATTEEAHHYRFQFGEGSAARHAVEAYRLGLTQATQFSQGTALDLDTPDDWRLLIGRAGVWGEGPAGMVASPPLSPGQEIIPLGGDQ
jgi:2-phospho-L-lactate guanylyltransferase